jgi:thioredoxin-related protein
VSVLIPRLKLLLVSAIIGSFLSSSSQTFQKPEQTIVWLKWEEAYKLSKETGKPIFISVYRNYCSFCKRMEVYVYTDPQIIKQISPNFLPVKIDANDEFTTFEVDGEKLIGAQLIKKFNGGQEIILPATLMFLTGSDHYFYKTGFQDVIDLKYNIIAYLREVSKLSTK